MKGLGLSRLLCGCLWPGLLLLFAAGPGAAAEIELLDVSRPELPDWEVKTFHGKTRYQLTQDVHGPCIRADSAGTASGLFRKVRIDLQQTPYLHWRWKVDGVLANVHEREKRGDDFAARIYLIMSGGLFFWNTRAINYVWANGQPIESLWDNPYTAHSAMLAVESGGAHAGEWREYRRNVREDIRRAFGRDERYIDAVAIMTDTDNTGLSASACYGAIGFSD
ncbi:MAG: DUF3047 domain-containing protein [Mariprofundaceae bacterium]|nr:DUF3047 domain-containing protein [Mariprofundaceae bacterium]